MREKRKKIEDAAERLINSEFGHLEYIQRDNLKQNFVDIMLSPEAKEYWQQGMYTKEQIIELVQLCINQNNLHYAKDGFLKMFGIEEFNFWMTKINKKKS